MNNGLLYLGSLMAFVLAALFGVPYFIDWNGYRGVFEEEASKVLGRDVRVGGAVNVRFLPTPFVRFEKVRLSDVTGQTGEPFLRAESFTMRLAVSPLLRGAFEANEIELNKP
ncbi:MAG: AsmA family protein, partial [Hyphomicrobium sp.]